MAARRDDRKPGCDAAPNVWTDYRFRSVAVPATLLPSRLPAVLKRASSHLTLPNAHRAAKLPAVPKRGPSRPIRAWPPRPAKSARRSTAAAGQLKPKAENDFRESPRPGRRSRSGGMRQCSARRCRRCRLPLAGGGRFVSAALLWTLGPVDSSVGDAQSVNFLIGSILLSAALDPELRNVNPGRSLRLRDPANAGPHAATPRLVRQVPRPFCPFFPLLAWPADFSVNGLAADFAVASCDADFPVAGSPTGFPVAAWLARPGFSRRCRPAVSTAGAPNDTPWLAGTHGPPPAIRIRRTSGR